MSMPKPQTHKEMKSFIGMVSWLRKLIPNCSMIVRSLIQAIKDDNAKFKAIEWTEEMENDFNTLKKILMTEPVMAHPDFTKKFYIHVDASR